jgi:hypothetical protein
VKLLCYGASVTAQKFETGYFQQLENSELKEKFSSIERVAFGASQYEYAGYAFIQDVLDKKPKVCVIDWLTPSMKGFNEYKITLLNKSLLEQNCLPIWVFFPRLNNFQEPTEAYSQVKNSAESFKVPFLDLREHMQDFSSDPSKYLRDAVHTTLVGAQRYASVIETFVFDLDIEHSIKESLLSDGYSTSIELNDTVPLVIDAKYKIDNESALQIDIQYQGGFFEIFFETEVGPHLCRLIFQVYQDNELCFEEKINPADPWSYYTRKMVVETLRRRIPPGDYTIRISKESGDPFESIETRKPIEVQWNDEERYIELTRISLNSHRAKINQLKMEG